MAGKPGTLAIDLGTSNTVVAIHKNNEFIVIPNEQGAKTTPSYVAFTQDEVYIGDIAKKQSGGNPENTIFGIKRIIGRKKDDRSVDGYIEKWPFSVEKVRGTFKINVEYLQQKMQFYPEQISAMILKKMKDIADDHMQMNHTDAVITVPAYFTDSQRRATQNAGRIAGLNVKCILNGPTAAALAYILKKTRAGDPSYIASEKHILVFDLGGGTFDVSILAVTDLNFQVKAVAGDAHLGGEDFDNRLVEHSLKKLKEEHGIDLKNDPKIPKKLLKLEKLRKECEDAKKALTSSENTIIYYDDVYSLKITRTEFEELCSELFRKIEGPIKDAILEAKIAETDIDEILFVGGSSRIPKLEQILSELFVGVTISKQNNPDEDVAVGAAIHAATLDNVDNPLIQRLVLTDVIPISMGISTKGGKMGRVLDKNSRIPAEYERKFYTCKDDQTEILVQVFEGENPMIENNQFLGEFYLSGIPKAKEGKEVYVKFDLDANGILGVTAKTLDSKGSVKAAINIETTAFGLSEDEMAYCIAAAKIFDRKKPENPKHAIAKIDLHAFCLSSVLEIQNWRHVPDKQALKEEFMDNIPWLLTAENLSMEELEKRKKKVEQRMESLTAKNTTDDAIEIDDDSDDDVDE